MVAREAITIAVMELPSGVRLIALTSHFDQRGSFTEVFRYEWDTGVKPQQWNIVHSNAGVLRGVHVHHRHWDYLLIVKGRATIGLRDLRDESPTRDVSATVSLAAQPAPDGGTPSVSSAIIIPPGVAHGFLFELDSTHLYSVSDYWQLDDELGCAWNDPALELDWPSDSPSISDRDRSLPPLADLLEELAEHQSRLWPMVLPADRPAGQR